MFVDKKYALCGKLFEYILEPVLKERSSMFYAIDFHKFIATSVYMYSKVGDCYTNDMLREFTDMMKSMDSSKLDSVLSFLDHIDQSELIGKILTFALCNRKQIENEIETMRKSDSEGLIRFWPLELSMTALHLLLANWGEEFESLEAYCDDSKPISAAERFFSAFVGRKDKAYIQFGDSRSSPLIYNLSGPIRTVDSKDFPGIQIADVLSSSLLHAITHGDEEFSEEWLHLAQGMTSYPIEPDLSCVDLAQEGAFVNSMVLTELVERSIRGQNLFENMLDFIYDMKFLYPQFVAETSC